MRKLVVLVFLLIIALPSLVKAQSYNALSYTAGSFNSHGCGGNGGVCFADLASFPVLYNGTITYCKDCQQLPLCATGGSGAIAVMIAGQWVCGGPTSGGPTGNISGNTLTISGQTVLGSPGMTGSTTIYGKPLTIQGVSNNGTDQISNINVNGVNNAKAFGAIGDVQVDYTNGCSLSANSTILNCTSALFTSSDVGKTIFVPDLTVVSITGTANNGSGAVRLTVGSTANLNTANTVSITGINPTGASLWNTTEALGTWPFTIVDGTHIDLTGSAYVNAYQGGGTVFNVHSPTLDATITGYTNANTVTINKSRTSAVSGQQILWGHDDTTALQNAYNSTASPFLYVPTGNYLARGLNWSSSTGTNKAKVFGDGGFGGTGIFFINVTDPGAAVGSTKVGVLHDGFIDSIHDIALFGGYQRGPDTAPTITFLSARHQPATGTSFNIDHDMNGVWIENDGINTYDMVLYGSEQFHFQNTIWQDLYSSKGLLYLSACNTPGFVIPWGGAFVAAPTSMTFTAIDGKKSVFSVANAGLQNGGGSIVLDDACDQDAIYSENFNKIYTNQTNSVFLTDTYTGTSTTGYLRGITIREFYGEPQTATVDRAVHLTAECGNCDIQGLWYAVEPLANIIPWDFGLGFVNSRADIDTSGNQSAPAHEFAANTCAGSYLNLGTQAPNLTRCSDWLYNNGWNWPGASVNGPAVIAPSLGINGHISVNTSGTGGVPTATGGGLQPGSTDSVGLGQTNAGSASMTITFAHPWPTTGPFGAAMVLCTLTDLGENNTWYEYGQTSTQVSFGCKQYNNTPCPGTNFVGYHCIGLGG